MQCSKCGSSEKVKAGCQQGRQRYKCKACGSHYTRSSKRGYPPEIKEKAVSLYLEGLGFRAIGRLLGVSNVAVLKWIRAAAETLPTPEIPAYVDIMEMDELWHFVKKRQSLSGSGLLLTVSETPSLTSRQVAVVQKR